MNILFIGDIVGKPGRRAVKELLPGIVQEHAVDFVIANGENAATGNGLTSSVLRELFGYGIDVVTSGNHIWKKKEIIPELDNEPRLLRPANYPPGAPGRGHGVYTAKNGEKVGVLNLMGRVYMAPIDCPFRAADILVTELKKETDIIIVDMHAEATSEKIAMGWYLDGRVNAVLGTHTHVATADWKILPKGTAYQTDVGMTGGFDGVLGVKKETIIKRFMDQVPAIFAVAEDDLRMNALLLINKDEIVFLEEKI